MRHLVGDVVRGRVASAAARVRFAASFLDRIAAAQDGKTADPR
jgi:hypothetical protein